MFLKLVWQSGKRLLAAAPRRPSVGNTRARTAAPVKCVCQHLRFNVSSFYHTQELPSSGSWDSPDSPLATMAFGSFDEMLLNRSGYLLRFTLCQSQGWGFLLIATLQPQQSPVVHWWIPDLSPAGASPISVWLPMLEGGIVTQRLRSGVRTGNTCLSPTRCNWGRKLQGEQRQHISSPSVVFPFLPYQLRGVHWLQGTFCH